MEIFTNDASTTLSAPMLIGDTTLSVVSGVQFPAGGTFRIRIDNELITVKSVSGTTWTVTRASEAVSGVQAAAAHAAGAGVAGVVSAGSLLTISNGDGTSFTPSTLATWALTDQAGIGATLVATGPSIALASPPSNLDNFCMALKAIPATPYSCIFHLKSEVPGVDYSECGVLWFDSVNVYTKTLSNLFNAAFGMLLQVGYATTGFAQTHTNNLLMIAARTGGWFKLSDDGTHQKYWVSADGLTWLLLWSENSNTNVTANKVGFFVNARNPSGLGSAAALWSYQETSP